jgi:hypothetical protein
MNAGASAQGSTSQHSVYYLTADRQRGEQWKRAKAGEILTARDSGRRQQAQSDAG